MELTKALTKERQDRIYKLYLTAFPESERKPFPLLIEKQEEGIVDILSIEEDGHFLGLWFFWTIWRSMKARETADTVL